MSVFEKLDFATFHKASTTAERDQFCRNLVSALKQTGFVRLVNHGIPHADIDRAFEMVMTSLTPLQQSTPTYLTIHPPIHLTL